MMWMGVLGSSDQRGAAILPVTAVSWQPECGEIVKIVKRKE